jgi:hypothetical protein
MVEAMVLSGLLRCKVLGLRLKTSTPASGECLWPRARTPADRAGFQPVLRTPGDSLEGERPRTSVTDRLYIVLKGPAPRQAAVGLRAGRDL